MNWVIGLILVLTTPLAWSRVGFQSGEQFFVHNVYAEIRVRCQTPSETMTTTYDCNESILLPVEIDFFTGPRGTRASDVVIFNLQDPRTRRSVGYNAHTGVSKTHINLWVRSVLQRPLLSFGTNHIEFELFDGQSPLSKGQFHVFVSRGASLSCQNVGNFQSNQIMDCQNPQKFCTEFIRSNNYCRP